jgi:hypothetical protein
VSREDYDWLMRRGKWLVTHPGRKAPACGTGYAYRCAPVVDGKKSLIWMHKVICLRAHGPPPTPLHVIADHRDGDTLDNRRHMLRWATHAMNAKNRFGWAYKQPELPLFLDGMGLT